MVPEAASLRPRARRAAVVVALGTLLAVFAMHGPSSGHTMLMPVGAVDVAPAATAHHAHAMEPMAGSPQQVSAGPSHTMQHGECVGTLRDDSVTAASAAVITVGREGASHWPGTSGTVLERHRGPPSPSPQRLCISRT